MTASRILVVDDEPSARSLYVITLESQGYVVDAASGAREALEALQHETYDLLITDLMMPHVDGIGLARGIRRDPQFVDMPIVLITALDDRETRIRALEVADAVMTKPLDMMELYLRLDMLIQGRLRVLALRERIQLSENSAVIAKVITPEVDGILGVSQEEDMITIAPRAGRRTHPSSKLGSVRPLRSGRSR
jgi:DNA-binding response OmpR family regulator